jgi:hypothetical protein
MRHEDLNRTTITGQGRERNRADAVGCYPYPRRLSARVDVGALGSQHAIDSH